MNFLGKMLRFRPEARKLLTPISRQMSGYDGGHPGVVRNNGSSLFSVYTLLSARRTCPLERDSKTVSVSLYFGQFWES